MNIGLDDIIMWLIVGALAGSLAGFIVKRKKEGYGRFTNIGIGLVGALIGGGVVRLFKIDLGLGNISVTIEDLIAAVLGSFLFLIVLWLIRNKLKK
jgi:uncharacterized membrane protein YeaQ/YmgE (transglycosylase-associated protein family)